MKFTHAVVMGDLVASEAFRSPRQLHELFNEAVASANERHRRDLASPLTITLGDEFQGLATRLETGLAVIKTLRTGLFQQNVPCRFVLGYARIETPLNTALAWNMMGPGLADAREKLTDKRSSNAYRFSLPQDPLPETLLDAIGLSLTDIEAGWTERQLQIVTASINTEEPDAEIARKVGIARNTLYKIRRAARFDLYRTQWTAVGAAVAHLDRLRGFT